MKIKSKLRNKQKRRFLIIFTLFLVFAISISLFQDKLLNKIMYNPASADTGYVSADSEVLEEIQEQKENNIIDENHDLLIDTVYTDNDGNNIIKNPDDILVLVNKERNLPSDYKPSDLVIPNVKFSFDGNSEKNI